MSKCIEAMYVSTRWKCRENGIQIERGRIENGAKRNRPIFVQAQQKSITNPKNTITTMVIPRPARR